MSYIHKRSGARISSSDYNNLDYWDKESFIPEQKVSPNSSSGDFLTSAVIGAATGSTLLGGLLGGSLLGGFAGDMFNGDLLD